ncbi:hypothetical protein EMIT0P171_150125 [Pseudomonas sp. IT-P171]
MVLNDNAGCLNARVILIKLFIDPYLPKLDPRAERHDLADYWFTKVFGAILGVCRS